MEELMDKTKETNGITTGEANAAPDISKSVEAPAEPLLPDEGFPLLTEPKTPPKTKLGMNIVLTMLAVSLLCSTMSVAAYDRFFAQKIVTINLRDFIEHQRDLYLAGKLTHDQVKQNLDGLIASVKKAPKNKIIILEDVVANSTEKFESK